MTDLHRIQTHARSILEGEGQDWERKVSAGAGFVRNTYEGQDYAERERFSSALLEHDPALVEAVAEALFLVSAEPEHGDSWGKTSPTAWGDNFRNHARAALSTIRKH